MAEKIGARRECILRKRLFLHGEARDAVLFSLVEEDLKWLVEDSSQRVLQCVQWFTCVHVSVTYLIRFSPVLFLLCSRPWLLTIAAEGGLEPAPVNRFRGALPHRSSSYTHWALLGPLRSWRTVIRITGKRTR